MRRAAATALVFALLVTSAGAAMPAKRITCAGATRLDQSAPLGRAVPLRNLVWLAVYPFQPGYPTKTVVMSQRRLERPLMLRGRNCATGAPLRFWYRDGLPFVHLPVTAAELRGTGSLHAAFGPWPKHGLRGGYLMFWRSGLWKIVGSRNGREVGVAFIRTSPR